MMKICLITPAAPGSRKGNRITALRWAGILRGLGHRVVVTQQYTGQRCDVLIALHARRSADSIARYRADRPAAPLVVALTGTDLYGDIHTASESQRSLALADRLVVLQPLGVQELPPEHRAKARVIYQSLPTPSFRAVPARDTFDVCVMGHLRAVKDPFRTALAARLLPASSRVRVLHLGAALSEDMKRQAREEEALNPRYRWLGDRPRSKALRQLARCRLLSLTSLTEGGANAVSEAIVVAVSVVSSRIAGSIGLLGEDYPGYFPVGDTEALAEMLLRAETEQAFLTELQRRCQERRGLFEPAEEARRWGELLAELSATV
jgi:putative glycosyltransferase (TIGR04348 family)